MVHYLLYSQRELNPYFTSQRIVELGWLGNITVIMEHFTTLVEQEQEPLSVERAMELLEKGARTLVTRLVHQSDGKRPYTKVHASTAKGTDHSPLLLLLLQQSRMRSQMPDFEMSLQDPDVKFTYEEEADPELFFVPYIWEVIYRETCQELHWVPESIIVFDLGGEDELSGSRGGGKGLSGSLDGSEDKGSLGNGRLPLVEAPTQILTMNV